MRPATISLLPVAVLLAASSALVFAGDARTAQAEDPILGKEIPQITFEQDPAQRDRDVGSATIRGEGFTFDRDEAIDYEMERGQGVPAKPRPELLSTSNTEGRSRVQ